MKNGYFEYNSGKIYFEIQGKGEPIVFIHGFTLDHNMWKQQIDFLKEKFWVITYDMRGFGKSSNPISQYSDYDDLKSLLNYLNIKNVNVVGLSLGGEVAIDFAISNPNLIKSLTLSDSSLGGYKSTVDWDVHSKEVGLEGAKQNWLNHNVFNTTRKNKEVFLNLKKMVKNYSGYDWLTDLKLVQKLNPRAIERLNEINVPTMIIVGEKDLDYFKNIADILHQKISNSEKHIIKNSGHMTNMEKPNEFNTLLLKFLNKQN